MKKRAKIFRSGFIVALCLILCGSALLGCKDKGDDPVRPDVFVIATDVLDGLFNPFFSTNANDVTIGGMTQLSLLSSDKDGNLSYGDEEACIVKDFSQSVTDNRTAQEKLDAAKDNFKPAADYYERYYTTYDFILKNGINFSDGSPLTIKDVLFNYYVYLDPSYTGSTTLYSVNIKGLKAYRSQKLEEGEQDGFDTYFDQKVDTRIKGILSYVRNEYISDAGKTLAQADILRAKRLFREELNADWTAAASKKEDYPNYPAITEQWQIFLVMEGFIQLTEKTVGGNKQYEIEWGGFQNPADKSQSALVQLVFEDKAGADGKSAYEDLTLAQRTSIAEIVQFWQTATTLRAELNAVEKAAYYDEVREENAGELLVKDISGLRYDGKVNEFTKYTDGTSTGATEKLTFGEAHDKVTIVINGVDPKAIWNFGFSVAPMKYYSKPELAAAADPALKKFGVKTGDIDFMNYIKSVAVPVGAGSYKAKGGTAKLSEFYYNNQVYFERNDGFLMGVPKIQYITYKVVDANRKFEEVQSGAVHYSDPSAKATTINAANADIRLATYEIPNLGYGYIGINAGKVTSLNVRRAFMHAMNMSLCLEYYTNNTASLIYYPMSKVNWAYPNANDPAFDTSTVRSEQAYEYWGGTAAGKNEIKKLIEGEGFALNGQGIYSRTNPVTGRAETLNYEFTVAGNNTDHPMFKTLLNAAAVLNSIGCKITLNSKPDALSKLTNGDLAVWAAAWGSTIDPDMYQVYHKDSQATSVLAWGYPYIKEYGSTTELKILDELSVLIDKGRASLVQSERKPVYQQALDKVLDLAVEFPSYQRNNLIVYNKTVLDSSTLLPKDDCRGYTDPLSKIWLVDFVK
ncbi:MAG: ABC transporter substrate-binding protein [Clostridiales bacterium]|jgi:peptide/nickel transport system substrate-binding protein|nr:ABC transporter substrate-binding protein [Clostridiales bacterium]